MTNQPELRNKKNTDLLEWYDAIIFAITVIVLVYTFGVRVVRVVGHSMDYTLQDKQLVLISSLPYTPAYGDIVVIDEYTQHGETLIKRVIGQAGDTIDIDFSAGIVYRNGVALEEPYTAEPTYLKETVIFPVTVPQGCLFVMGDNRNRSTDSRDADVGCVDVRDILGKVIVH